MRTTRTATTFAAALITALACGQINYNDVAVIVNANDPASVNIGNYFRDARSIPEVNMILIDAPLSESVDTVQFNDLRQQIEAYLIANQLVDSINYIVCIKGVPHRVELPSCSDTLPNGCSSFDSEIALFLGPDSNYVLQGGPRPNPFSTSTQHHQRAQSGIYLVTRLDGFTELDVLHLIDRSGPAQLVEMASSTVLIDISHSPWYVNALGVGMQNALQPLADAGWNVMLDTADAAVQGLTDLAGFMSVDLSPEPGAFPNTWTAGAIASEVNSFGAYTFDPLDPDPRRNRAAYLISYGATGARGVVTQAYSSIGSQMTVSLNRYLDTLNFNLAESYWAGMPVMSYTDLVIGDPKTSVIVDLTNGVEEVNLLEIPIRYDAVSATLTFSPSQNATGPFVVEVLDPIGRLVVQQRMIAAEPLSLAHVASGVYVVRVSNSDRPLGFSKFIKPW